MSYSHTSELTKLQNNFQNIWILKDEIVKAKQTIAAKLAHLKTAYGELTKKNTKSLLNGFKTIIINSLES